MYHSPWPLLVPVTGLEPVRCRQRWILSPLRLPFHHTGRCLNSIHHVFENSKRENREYWQELLHLYEGYVIINKKGGAK